MTIRQSKLSANQYWENIIYQVKGGSGVPTVTTTSLNMNFNTTATIYGNVVSQGSNVLTAHGFVYSHTNTNPTLSDSVITTGTGSFTGAYNSTTSPLTFPDTYYFAAYATNAAGTGYGSVLSGGVQICFAEGTKITTIYGSKNIEDVKYEDDLLAWNFDEGVFTRAKPVWILQPFKANYYGLLKFSNGLELRTVADGRGHRILNIEKGMFTYSMCEDTPIGTTTFTHENERIKLVGKEVVRKDTMFYNVITHTHINVFANNILTSTGLNNLYPISDMKFVKEERKLRSREEFDVSDELFVGLRLSEQTGDIKDKLKWMQSRQITSR
jgi:hypothetical protein